MYDGIFSLKFVSSTSMIFLIVMCLKISLRNATALTRFDRCEESCGTLGMISKELSKLRRQQTDVQLPIEI